MKNRVVLVIAVVGAAVVSTACPDEELGGLPGTVAGKICNPVTGRAAPNVEVTATFVRSNGDQGEKSTETDENGFYKIGGLPAGDIELEGVGPDFKTKKIKATIEARKEIQKDDPACRDTPPEPGTGNIVGQVCNRHVGDWVKNGTVIVQLSDGTQLTATTDPEDGHFALLDVPEGVYSVIVDAAGFRKSYTVTVVAGEDAFVEEQSLSCTPPDPLTTGKIVGTICGNEEQGSPGEPLEGVHVEIVGGLDDDGAVYDDVTAADGSFIIAGIPAPSQNLVVRATKGGFFYQWPDDSVSPDGDAAVAVFPISGNNARPDGTNLTASVGCQELVPDDGRRYLVIDGVFDDIGAVLVRMGLEQLITPLEGVPTDVTHQWTADAFSDYEYLSSFDAVFVNCGISEVDFDLGMNAAYKANIRQYIQEGGSLYVSDWAYDLVEAVYPEKINFLRDDTENDGAEYGVDGSYTAEVLDDGLAEYLGSNSVDINFSFGNFVLISEVAPDVTTYLRADMQYAVNGGASVLQDAPVTVGFSDGLGRVIYTTFHQETDSDGNTEELDGPEDLALRYLVFSL